MPTTAERLDRLEQENAALKAEVGRLKGKVEPVAPTLPPGGTPYVERQATMTTYKDPPPPDLTDDDLRALRRLVGSAHPSIAPPLTGENECQALRRFGNALRAVGMLYGTTELDKEHGLAWWTDHAQSIVDPGAGQADFNGNDFTAAALASGVWYRAWSPSSSVEFGLVRYRIHGATSWLLREAWRDTLKRGHIFPPSAPARAPVDHMRGSAMRAGYGR